jgi:hypothetical protein
MNIKVLWKGDVCVKRRIDSLEISDSILTVDLMNSRIMSEMVDDISNPFLYRWAKLCPGAWKPNTTRRTALRSWTGTPGHEKTEPQINGLRYELDVSVQDCFASIVGSFFRVCLVYL